MLLQIGEQFSVLDEARFEPDTLIIVERHGSPAGLALVGIAH